MSSVHNHAGCLKRKSVFFVFLFLWINAAILNMSWFNRQSDGYIWVLHAVPKQGQRDKSLFSYRYDRAMDIQVCCRDSQALIKVLLDKMKKQSGLHIWREVPFNRRKETGRRETKRRTENVNDTTFQSNWYKHAISSRVTGLIQLIKCLFYVSNCRLVFFLF